jgi:dCTP deaminase
MSALGENELRKRIQERPDNRNDYKGRLIVTPLLSDKQITEASIDVRLGSSIVVPRRVFVGNHDVTDQTSSAESESRLYERIQLKYHARFMLHPNQLILACTLEYVSLPLDICCMVASRSSWGRLGLVVATASFVQPGFQGCITLELANLSDSPIALFPGLLVGQLIFFDAVGGVMYKGRYDCPTEAGLPRFYGKQRVDDEMHFWGKTGAPILPGFTVK